MREKPSKNHNTYERRKAFWWIFIKIFVVWKAEFFFFLSSLYFSTAELFPGGIQELFTLQQHKFLTLRLGSAGYNLL